MAKITLYKSYQHEAPYMAAIGWGLTLAPRTDDKYWKSTAETEITADLPEGWSVELDSMGALQVWGADGYVAELSLGYGDVPTLRSWGGQVYRLDEGGVFREAGHHDTP